MVVVTIQSIKVNNWNNWLNASIHTLHWPIAYNLLAAIPVTTTA